MYSTLGCEGRTGPSKESYDFRIGFCCVHRGYPEDIVRDPVVTIHVPAKETVWFPTVRHPGNIVM